MLNDLKVFHASPRGYQSSQTTLFIINLGKELNIPSQDPARNMKPYILTNKNIKEGHHLLLDLKFFFFDDLYTDRKA